PVARLVRSQRPAASRAGAEVARRRAQRCGARRAGRPLAPRRVVRPAGQHREARAIRRGAVPAAAGPRLDPGGLVMSVARVLDVARREIGVAESPPNSNKQKYGRAYGWDGVAWCAIFVWWVLTQAGCGALIPKTASTVVMRDWYMKRGQWLTKNPKPGDLVFFKFSGNSNPVNHVGIVEAVEKSGALITIEGNTTGTSAGDQRN